MSRIISLALGVIGAQVCSRFDVDGGLAFILGGVAMTIAFALAEWRRDK